MIIVYRWRVPVASIFHPRHVEMHGNVLTIPVPLYICALTLDWQISSNQMVEKGKVQGNNSRSRKLVSIVD
jgi:hypothetical protein